LIITQLQQDIEAIYRLDGCPAIEPFLISTAEARELFPEITPLRPQVLLKEEEGEISLAVHFGDHTLERLEKEGLSQGGLGDFLSAVEEVSHFVFLSWNAQNLRKVTLLDVEFQGEIDKFLLASQYFAESDGLFVRLFEQIAYDETLNEEARERYREANRLGGKYLKSLGGIFVDGLAKPQVLAQLRAFYRQSSLARLSLAEAL
jgi:hypothetical protein